MSTDAAHPPTIADFLGLGIAELELADAVTDIRSRSRHDRFSFIVTPNVDHVVRLSREPADGAFRAAYRAAALRLCDSRILASLARAFGEKLPVAAGSDLTASLFADVLAPDDRIAIIGGDAGLHTRLTHLFPSLRFAFIDAPMRLATNPEARRTVVDAIEAARADYVFLAVGAPQSEMIAAEVTARGAVGGVGLCIGASLEFITGAKRRAPVWMQQLKLEWLHRLLSEPRRLWRRYLIEGPMIFAIVARWKLTARPV